MKPVFWSATLQYARIFFGAGLFLIAARYLSLAEIGAFAAAFAPVRLMQIILRGSLVDAITVADLDNIERREGFLLAGGLGLAASACLVTAAVLLPGPVSEILIALAPVPLIQGLGTCAEAALRRSLRIRALALRTALVQLVAAGLALAALVAGFGVFSLVVFAFGNAVGTTVASVAMARLWPARPVVGIDRLRMVYPTVIRLVARDLAASATLPLLQIAVGIALGLPAAGAFQIAIRIAGLIDGLAIAPLRYIALPQLRSGSENGALQDVLRAGLRGAAATGSFACLGALAAGPEIARLAAGMDHAGAVQPLLPGFCLLGLASAVAMPVVQALTATGAAWLTTARAAAVLIVTLLMAVPLLAVSVAAVAAVLPVAAIVVLVPFLCRALRLLDLPVRDFVSEVAPPVLAGAAMATALAVAGPVIGSLPALAGLTVKTALGGSFFLSLMAAMTQLPHKAIAR